MNLLIWALIKKQFLLLVRNRQDLFLLFLMPFILITILGFSLSGFMSGETISLEAKVAVIEHGKEEDEIDLFLEQIQVNNLSSEELQKLEEEAKQLSPISILKNKVFASRELKESISVEIYDDPLVLEDLKKNDEYTAIIEFPKNFTTDLLNNVFLHKETSPVIYIYKNEGEPYAAEMVEGIINNFRDQYNRITVIGLNGLMDHEEIQQLINDIQGNIQTVNEMNPISSFEYYTVGMAAMFILFIASIISTTAIQEKRLHVFNRILLSHTSRWTYYTSMFLSSWLLACIQQIIILAGTSMIFQFNWHDYIDVFIAIIVVSFAVSGLTCLLTALNYRFNSEEVSTAFGTFILAILAFFGGSYFPVSELTPLIQMIGEFTPNGAGMTSYMMLLQGYEISDISGRLTYLIGFGLMMLLIGIVSFPKRGDA